MGCSNQSLDQLIKCNMCLQVWCFLVCFPCITSPSARTCCAFFRINHVVQIGGILGYPCRARFLFRPRHVQHSLEVCVCVCDIGENNSSLPALISCKSVFFMCALLGRVFRAGPSCTGKYWARILQVVTWYECSNQARLIHFASNVRSLEVSCSRGGRQFVPVR